MIRIYLLEMLDRMGISQVELSRRTGIRPATINQYYHEEITRMNLNNLDKICEALNCRVSDILEFVPNKKSSV